MPAPIAKGLIIFTSILVAAGIALYEDPAVKAWVDRSRRKIAIALHSLGDELDPPSRDSPDSRRRSRDASDNNDETASRRRREDIVRRNRNELIRRARDDGVAVDLDELTSIGRESEAEALARAQKWRDQDDRSDKSKSFDQLVGSDGTLRAETTATEASSADGAGLRHRGAGARDVFTSTELEKNPFADEDVLFDRDVMDNADKPRGEQSDARSATESFDAASQVSDQKPLIDLDPQPVSEMTLINTAPPVSISASFHSALSSPSTLSQHSFVPDDNDAPTPTGTMTPVEEDGFSTAASMVGSNADDIGAIDLLSDAGASEASSFSHVSGTHTPSTWSDIGSDEGSEEEFHQQH